MSAQGSTTPGSPGRLAVVLLVAVLLGATPAGAVAVEAPIGQADGARATATEAGASVVATDGDAPGVPFGTFHWADDDESDDEDGDDDQSEEDDGSTSDGDEDANADDATTSDGADDDPIERLLTEITGDSGDDADGDGGSESDGDGGDAGDAGGSSADEGGPDRDGSDGPVEPSGDGGPSASGGGSQPVAANEDAATSDDDGRNDLAQVETTPPPVTNGTPEPERFHVEDARVNRSTVAVGEPVLISATVVNPYSTAATRRVWLRVFGEVVDVRNVTVPSESTRQVSFVRRVAAPGTYEAYVNDASVTFAVTAAASATSAAGTTTGAESTGQAPGFTAPVAVLGVLAALLLGWRRRR